MNILTFDVEEWFHILDHESTKSQKYWSNYEYRLDKNIDDLLKILQKHNQKATFFCLGWLNKKHKHIIKKLDEYGYEIGSHSMYHQLVYNQKVSEFEEDLKESIHSLEDTIGKKITTYRAPGFSVKEENRWFFELLLKYGIKIDCSIFPAKRAHGGFDNFSFSKPSLIKSKEIFLKELPMNTFNIFGKKFIFTGGGYFRITPLSFLDYHIRYSDYIMTYMHPHDFDKNKPLLSDLSPIRKFKSKVGLKSSMKKLEYLIKNHEFLDIAEADKRIDWDNAPTIDLTERRKIQRRVCEK